MKSCFSASLDVDIPVDERPAPIEHYLRQPQRLVKAIAHTSNITALGEDRYRLKMRPFNFLSLTLQPVVDLRVWWIENGLRLQSMACQIYGVDYINSRFYLDLSGKLQAKSVGDRIHLQGRANLEVRVDVPFPISLTPQPILEISGQSLLKSILLTMKQRLSQQLLADYYQWADQVHQDTPVSWSLPSTSLP